MHISDTESCISKRTTAGNQRLSGHRMQQWLLSTLAIGKVTSIMHSVRCLFFIRASFNLHLEATHIPGTLNHLADVVSRDNLAFLYSQVPAAPLSRTSIPPQLVSLLVVNPIDWTSPDWSQQFGTCFLQAWPHQH